MPKFINDITMSAGAKVTGLPTPSASSDAASKSYVDDKTAEIYTSVTDDFNDTTKIGTNVGVVVDTGLGLVRPAISSYSENFADTQYNEQLTSNTIDVSGGVAKVFTGGVGYDPTAATNSNNLSILQTEEFNVTGGTQIKVTPTFTTPTGITAHTSPSQALQIHESSTAEHLMASANVGTVDWVASYFLGTVSSSLKIKRIDYSTNTSIESTVFSNGSYTTAQSDTNIKNVSVVVGDGSVFVAYPSTSTTAGYAIRKLNASTLADESTLLLDVNGLGLSPNIQGIDLAYYSNGLYIICCVNTSTQSSVLLSGKITVYTGTLTLGTSNELVKYPNTTDKSYKARFAKQLDVNGNLAWASFTRKTTVGAVFGIINPATGNQYRTSPATQTATTPNTMKAGCLTLSVSCNGNGNIVYDSVNNFYYLFWVRGSSGDINITRIGTGTTDAAATATLFSTAPYDTTTNRDICGILDPTTTSNRTLNLFFANTARQNLILAKLNVTTAGVFTSLSTTTLFRDASTTNVLAPIHVVQSSTSLLRYRLYFNYQTDVDLMEYKANIQPILRVGIRGANDTTIAGTTVTSATNATTITFNPTSTVNTVSVRFEFEFPILSTDFTGANRSVELASYILEKSLPTDSTPTSSWFTSTALVTDRIVRSVTLDVTQSLGTTAGNTISWQVASLGDNWVNIGQSNTPPWTVNFDEGQYGSQLRVKATLNKAEGATTIAQVPTIQKYVANVKNVVTVNDIFPMQVNLLKLSLYVNTQVTANRYGYKNQMVDLFSSADGIASSDGMTLTSGTYTNTSGSNKTLTSTQETADISTVSSIIVVGDASNSVTYQVRRGDGDTWATVTPETVYTFQTGTPANKVQIRAIVPDGGSITGWAYLYA